MKKYILLILPILFLTGCSNIKNMDYNLITNQVFNEPVGKANVSLQGYKLYLPKGMSLVGDLNANNLLYSEGEKYYLYVDLISYYNKKINNYKINAENNTIYSRDLDYDKKTGYVLITKRDDNNYFLQASYNYGKIEVITRYPKKALAKSLALLRGIQYNDKIISSLIGNDALDYNEEKFMLDNKKSNTDSFLKYEEQYGVYDDKDKELPDEDKINIIDDMNQ